MDIKQLYKDLEEINNYYVSAKYKTWVCVSVNAKTTKELDEKTFNKVNCYIGHIKINDTIKQFEKESLEELKLVLDDYLRNL